MPKDRQLLFYFSLLIAWLLACVVISMLIYQSTSRRTRIQWSPLSCSHGYLNCAYLKQSGLGNLMFQYASMFGVAKTKGMTLVVPTGFRLSRYFELPALPDAPPSSEHAAYTYHELKSNAYDALLMSKLDPCHNSTLVGYFQSYKYFEQYQTQLAVQLQFRDEIRRRATRFLDEAVRQTYPLHTRAEVLLVGVHVRRGDMVTPRARQFGYVSPGKDYYVRAVSQLQSTYKERRLLFVVASDDIPWCEANFDDVRAHFVFSRGHPDYVELAMLSQCEHVVASAGTFSWWAAWLSPGNVTYFKGFPKPGSALDAGFSFDRSDYYPEKWVALS